MSADFVLILAGVALFIVIPLLIGCVIWWAERNYDEDEYV